MARKDEQRWRDLHTSRGRPFRPAQRCKECGDEFWLLIPRQELCHPCAWAEVEAQRAPLTADRIEYERCMHDLASIAEEQAARTAPPTDYANLTRRADALAARLHNTPQRAPKNRPTGGFSAPAEWIPLARKKAKAGWGHRKIADFLGVSRKEVGFWLSLKDIEGDLFLAACEGKLKPGNKEFSGDPRLLWCYAKYASRCRLCAGTVHVGDRMVRVDGRWVHAACAVDRGHDVVEGLENRSRVQVKADRLRVRS